MIQPLTRGTAHLGCAPTPDGQKVYDHALPQDETGLPQDEIALGEVVHLAFCGAW